MADTQNSLEEAVGVGTTAASQLKLLKASPALAGGFGSAAAGPIGAAIGTVIQHRHMIGKIAAAIFGVLMIPILFIVMLPSLIFGSLTADTGALNSNTVINENIRNANQAIIEILMESHNDILSEINALIAGLPEGDTASITDPYAYSISVNANLLIAQFCASRDHYQDINIEELTRMIRENKTGLFSYDETTETVTMEVTVGGGAEGTAGEEAESEPETKTVTFTMHTYTVQYAGDAYFADHVFHLTDKQKALADDYAENLTLFFGSASSGVATANVSDEVLAYRATVEQIAQKYGMTQYVELILAVMMQESGGRGLDVM